MFYLFLLIAGVAGGYAASIYTWPWVRTQALGARAQVTKLRQRAADLEAKIRGAF
jgi:hypothetical protein